MSKHKVFRDGNVHVLADKCASCIFRSVNDGRIQGLRPGRVAGMVQEARANESVIPCHSTIHVRGVMPAVCRGFWDLPRRGYLLQVAERLGRVVYDRPPAG